MKYDILFYQKKIEEYTELLATHPGVWVFIEIGMTCDEHIKELEKRIEALEVELKEEAGLREQMAEELDNARGALDEIYTIAKRF